MKLVRSVMARGGQFHWRNGVEVASARQVGVDMDRRSFIAQSSAVAAFSMVSSCPDDSTDENVRILRAARLPDERIDLEFEYSFPSMDSIRIAQVGQSQEEQPLGELNASGRRRFVTTASSLVFTDLSGTRVATTSIEAALSHLMQQPYCISDADTNAVRRTLAWARYKYAVGQDYNEDKNHRGAAQLFKFAMSCDGDPCNEDARLGYVSALTASGHFQKAADALDYMLARPAWFTARALNIASANRSEIAAKLGDQRKALFEVKREPFSRFHPRLCQANCTPPKSQRVTRGAVIRRQRASAKTQKRASLGQGSEDAANKNKAFANLLLPARAEYRKSRKISPDQYPPYTGANWTAYMSQDTPTAEKQSIGYFPSVAKGPIVLPRGYDVSAVLEFLSKHQNFGDRQQWQRENKGAWTLGWIQFSLTDPDQKAKVLSYQPATVHVAIAVPNADKMPDGRYAFRYCLQYLYREPNDTSPRPVKIDDIPHQVLRNVATSFSAEMQYIFSSL
jgi:hypothetical protein